MQELPEGDEYADPTACGVPLRVPQPESSYLVARPGRGCMDVALKQTPSWPLVQSGEHSAQRCCIDTVPSHGSACLLRHGPRV